MNTFACLAPGSPVAKTRPANTWHLQTVLSSLQFYLELADSSTEHSCFPIESTALGAENVTNKPDMAGWGRNNLLNAGYPPLEPFPLPTLWRGHTCDHQLQGGTVVGTGHLVFLILALIPTGIAPCTLHGGLKEHCRTHLFWFEFLAWKLHLILTEDNFGNIILWKICTSG